MRNMPPSRWNISSFRGVKGSRCTGLARAMITPWKLPRPMREPARHAGGRPPGVVVAMIRVPPGMANGKRMSGSMLARRRPWCDRGTTVPAHVDLRSVEVPGADRTRHIGVATQRRVDGVEQVLAGRCLDDVAR